MEGQEVPQLSKEGKQEFNRIMLEFLKKWLPSEAISQIEVEIKFKREDKEVLLSLRGGCVPGTPDDATDPCLVFDPTGHYRWDPFA